MSCEFHQIVSSDKGAPCAACIQAPSDETWTLRPVTVVHYLVPNLDQSEAEIRESIVRAVTEVFVEHGAQVKSDVETASGLAAFRANARDEHAISNALSCALEAKEMLRDHTRSEWREATGILELRGGIATGLMLVNEAGEVAPNGGGVPVVIARILASAAGPDELLSDEFSALSGQASEAFEAVAPLTHAGIQVPAWNVNTLALPRRRHAGRLLSQRSQRALVGRERELSQVQETFEIALESQQLQRVAIVGERGSGRGRFIDEAAERITVAWKESTATRAMIRGQDEMKVPFELRRDLVSSLLDAFSEAESPEERLNETLAALATHQPALTDRFVRERLAIVAGITELSSEAARDADHASEATYVAVSTLMKAAAQRGGLVMSVHDLGNAGEDHRRQLLRLLDGLRGLPVLVLYATAPGHVPERDWGLSEVDDHEVRLEALTLQAGTHLLDQLLGRPDALLPEISRKLVEHCKGLPLVLEQLLAALGDTEQLRQDRADGRWHIDNAEAIERLPDELGALFSSRLDQLAPDELTALTRAAIVGSVFWRSLVGDLGTRNVSAVFRRLEDRGFVRQLTGKELAAEVAYGFTHPNLRPLLLSRSEEEERGLIHAKTARWLTTHARDDDMRWTSAIAWHFRCGNEREQSATYDMRAGKWARETGDLGLAIEHFERAHTDSPTQELQIEALLAQGESLLLARRPNEAHPLLDEAATWIDEEGDPELVLRCLGARIYALNDALDLEQTEELIERALPLAASLGDKRAEARLLLEQARVNLGRGKHQDALSALERAAPMAEAEQDALVQTSVHLLLGRLQMHMGELSKARATLDEAAQQATELHHEVLYELAREGKAWVALAQGEVDEGAALFKDGARVFDRLGSPRPALRCALGLAHVSASRSNFTEAANEAADAYTRAHDSGEPVLEAWALSSIAWIFGEVKRGKHKLKAKALNAAAIRVAKIDLGEHLTRAMQALDKVGGGPGLYRGHTALALAEHLSDQNAEGLDEAMKVAREAVEGFESGRLRIRYEALETRA